MRQVRDDSTGALDEILGADEASLLRERLWGGRR